MEEITISSKGQVVIPKYLRDALGWKEGTIIAASLADNKIVLMKKPENPLDALANEGSKMAMKNIRRHIKTE